MKKVESVSQVALLQITHLGNQGKDPSLSGLLLSGDGISHRKSNVSCREATFFQKLREFDCSVLRSRFSLRSFLLLIRESEDTVEGMFDRYLSRWRGGSICSVHLF